MKSELRILTPQGMLGYGIPEEHFWRGVQAGPDAIVVDSGSTDPGPYLLGLSKTLVTREAYLRDVSLLIQAAAEHQIKLIISSAGGPGIDKHVDEMIDLIREISAPKNYRFRVAAIYSNVDKAVVRGKLKQGQITECGPS